ncbi:MAG: IMP cyclohydrolase [Candidatus Hydrogenedentota bacterium]|nr:MAG: IMP cyclohydrolase [Candidatus Hydrogenedentota bacterium]
MPKIKRAILSCYDKTGLVELASSLKDLNVEIITTEGTHQTLVDAGIETQELAEFTGVREMLNGRVKSLHPKVHAGMLGIRDNKLHAEEMQTYEYKWIDLVVVNLHPIAELVAHPNLTPEEVVEQVDIGGIAMIRSAAKNFRYVTVAVDPSHYGSIVHAMHAHEGTVPFTTRFKLAKEAFAATAQYDDVLAQYLERSEPPEE